MKTLFMFPLLLYCCSLSAGENHLTILPSKSTHSKFEGEAFYVACESSGQSVQRLMWTGPNGRQIPSSKASGNNQAMPRIHVEDATGAGDNADLFFRNISKNDSGKYTCSANVDGKPTKKSFELVVFKPIDFSKTPAEQYLEEGRDSALRCVVDGEPAPRISWNAHGRAVKFGKGSKYMAHPTHRNWLMVKNATLKDKGKYICKAIQLTSSTSDIRKHVINVKVHHKPLPISEVPKEFYGYVGGMVNLTCAALAEPSAQFTWLDKNDREIHQSGKVRIFNENRRSYLQLEIKNKNMFGDYYCKAQNRMGVLERVVTLQEGTKPQVPSAKVRNVRNNVFFLELSSVDIDREMPVTGYKIEYKQEGDHWKRARIREFTKGKPYILDGLQGLTKYVLRAYSKNIAGYSDPTKEFKDTTGKEVPRNRLLSGASSVFANSLVFLLVGTTAIVSLCSANALVLS